MKRFPQVSLGLLAACATLASLAGPPMAPITAELRPGKIAWTASSPHGPATLRISAPDGTVRDLALTGAALELDVKQAGLQDGLHVYEITLMPPPGMDPAQAQATVRQRLASGAFTVAAGQLVGVSPGPEAPPAHAKTATFSTKDQVVTDDLVVQSSLCVGLDCVNGENFGFDTIRLKGNNLRIHFDDTSAAAGVPANSWRLTANDSASGGASYFAIDDATSGNRVFSVSAGAPDSSLYIASTGKLGLRTATPVLDVHTRTGNTPAIRLEQSSAGGYTAQTWDIGANEANFFVRDVTNGSKLPLRIRPGAPNNSLDIAASGAVGMGTASPAAALHVIRSDGTAQLLVDESSSTAAPRTLLTLANNGPALLRFTTGVGTGWDMASGTALTLATQGAATPQFTLAANGNLAITGTLSTGSSRTLKTGIVPIDTTALLDKVLSLPLYHWRYKSSPAQERHVGPMAEDFRRLFQLGPDDKSLAPADLAGVTLGAVQALAHKVSQREAEIAAIKGRIAALEAQVAAPTTRPTR